ncbi:hypothetical protein JW906_15370, partial [bacterium]|nr:hypothetical protein [bacterium]
MAPAFPHLAITVVIFSGPSGDMDHGIEVPYRIRPVGCPMKGDVKGIFHLSRDGEDFFSLKHPA